MIQAVFFDLDGTLLPMQMDQFIKAYFAAAAQKMGPMGLDVQKMFEGLWKGTDAMVANDGSRPNEECFWETFAQVMGDEILQLKPDFDEFYLHEFEQARAVTHVNPQAREIVDWLKERNVRLAVATNPVFPMAAQLKRLGWAGFQPEEFEWVTAYENSWYCKPNPAYFQAILDQLNLKAEETVMVGNDIGEDMAAAQLGMPVFLLTDCLWNPKKLDTSPYPQGDFQALRQWMEGLLPPGGKGDEAKE